MNGIFFESANINILKKDSINYKSLCCAHLNSSDNILTEPGEMDGVVEELAGYQHLQLTHEHSTTLTAGPPTLFLDPDRLTGCRQ